MTTPTNEPPSRPTRLQAALRMEYVPREKWPWILARVIVGVSLIIGGAWFLRFMVAVHRETKELSATLLWIGVGFIIVGSLVTAGKFIWRAIMAGKEPLTFLRTLWKGPPQ